MNRSSQTSKKRMLSVQGYTSINLMMRICFEEVCGVEVIPVETGSLAFDLVQSDPNFELVIMGMNLRGMDGYRLTRELRRIGYSGKIIGFSSTPAWESAVIKSLKNGMDHYVLKPRYNELAQWMHTYNIIQRNPFALEGTLQNEQN